MFWQQKLDGYRVIAFLRGGRLHFQSRSGADLTEHFPELQAAAGIGMDLVLDGELVVLQGGRLDFTRCSSGPGWRAFAPARPAGRCRRMSSPSTCWRPTERY
ncbi:ATP-dependent DNA ligase [Streptomyces albidoflavus]|uniref:ATP-dependent DNA ligase n=1 Tax=Streptomyces albidoflavus TaxID=1886 RepID=UPI0034A4A087